QGYFAFDPDGRPDATVFNRVVTLRDTWAKQQDKAKVEPDKAAPAKSADKAKAIVSKTIDEPQRALSESEKAQRERIVALGVPEREAELIVLQEGLPAFFDHAVRKHDDPRAVAKWIVNELLRELKSRQLTELPFGGTELGELVGMAASGRITNTVAKDVFASMLAGEGDPGTLVRERGLEQMGSAEEVAALVEEVLAANADKVEAYRGGKVALLGFFVGQVMRASRGKANPGVVKQVLEDKLKS
ncbi:MAG: glutamine--tRNA ligase, partial [Myxococcota bacterium]